MRILIIEDNIELCQYMKKSLTREGFTVDISFCGKEGEEKAYVNEYDIILLDLNLPERDGLEIIRFLRNSNIMTPVIMITARAEITDRVLGLDSGADDYIIKPFDLIELKSRIHAVVRRFQGRTNPLIYIGMLTVNPLTRQSEFAGTPIPLSVKEFDILEVIASRYPAVVSGEEIAEHIFDETYDTFSSSLRVHIMRLRNKLHDAADKELLKTMRGKGYYLCLK
jgi:Response regulators consisting of a CheY-like receiver domain and a winged-helix DNA-binding domain